MSTVDPVAPEARRARVAVAVVFFTNAVLYANLLPRIPEIRDGIGLSNAALGSAVAAAPAGALLAGWFAPVLIRRFGSAQLASNGLVLLAGVLVGIPFATSWIALAGILFVMGACDGVIDVAQNAHGFRVQRRYRRSIVNTFHGMWSVGAVAGGLYGSATAGLGVSLTVHVIAVAVSFGLVALVCGRFMLPGPDDAERPVATSPGPAAVGEAVAARPVARFGRVSSKAVLVLAAFGILSICAAVVEDAGASWGAIYLRDELATGAALAGSAFVAMQAAMTVGRFTGDRLVDRFGHVAVVRSGGGVIVVGMGLALAAPSVATTVVGFALAGLGVATLVPVAMHAADELPGLPAGVGLTAVSWTLRVGFLASPPLVGLISDAVSLRVALLGVPIAGLAIMLLATTLRPRSPHP